VASGINNFLKIVVITVTRKKHFSQGSRWRGSKIFSVYCVERCDHLRCMAGTLRDRLQLEKLRIRSTW
jgi:hypothetical protein